MSIRSLALFSLCATAAIVAGFLIVFPHVSKAKTTGKPSPARLRVLNEIDHRRRADFVEPIYAAITRNDPSAVETGWHRYAMCPTYLEDPVLRLHIARFLLEHGKRAEAHAQLDKILHPPKGSSSSLQASGEVMSLWLSTSDREGLSSTAAARRDWGDALKQRGAIGNGADELPQPAKVEYLAAQELEAQTRPVDALGHYARAVRLAPDSSFLWSALGHAKERAGDRQGAKEALVRAYFTAPEAERAQIRRENGLQDRDLTGLKP